MRSDLTHLLTLLILLFPYHFSAQEFTLSEKCSKCRTITQQFKEGLVRTAKSNFGGGNTDWEEKKLSKFATSETRLIEIMESICSSDKYCSMFLESQEDTIEKWWFDNTELLQLKSTSESGAIEVTNLFADFLCVKETSVCCPNNTYGLSCTLCPTKVTGKSCSGHGSCDGEGTRSGSGKCHCSRGYVGDECSSCDGGYFSTTPNEDTVTCTSCETNCEQCESAGPGQCSQCNIGFLLTKTEEGSDVGFCSDIDECESEENPCKSPSTYCANVPGSYKCISCDSSCDSAGCTGAGPGACIGDCVTGYRKQDGRCEDIDECAEAEANNITLCSKQGVVEENGTQTVSAICINTPGSYRCGCAAEGYEYGEGVCLPKPPPPPAEKESEEAGKKKYTEKKRRDVNKPLSNKGPGSSKVASSLETDFSLIHFCIILVVAIVVISVLASKPWPWPAVAAVFMAITAVYVYYYTNSHEPKTTGDSGADSKFAHQKGSSRRN